MSNDEINRMIEDYLNDILPLAKSDSIYGRIYYGGVFTKKEGSRFVGKISKLMAKKDMSFVESAKVLIKESLIKKATELSETGVPTLESVKAVIKKTENDIKMSDEEHEKFMKSLKGGSSALLYIPIWAILTFFLALAINLAFWGALTSHYGKNYWETLFSDGLWTFLVGGIGSIFIMVLFKEFPF